MKNEYKIAVAGIGYVGLANAILLAQYHKVIAVDINESKVNMINQRKSPIVDYEIEQYLENHTLNLVATKDSIVAYKDVDYVIIATPTNFSSELNCFDTTSIEKVIDLVIKTNPEATIIIKSTVPIGYTESICKRFNSNNIIFSPEFLREGHALYDNLYPSRIIMGGCWIDSNLKENAYNFTKIYKYCTIKKNIPILYVNPSEAEAIKLFANTYLALRVSFYNELDTYAEMKNLNTKQIIRGMGLDPRIGEHYNNPSFGYGGYCLPKDTKQLLANYDGVPENLIKAIVQSNYTRKKFISEKILKLSHFSINSKDKDFGNAKPVIGFYRLIMKANSDNFRESSVIDIIESIERQVDIVIYEPECKDKMFHGNKVINNLVKFKSMSNLIVANRYSKELEDVWEKLYTRDIYISDLDDEQME
ncbi:nucleotide sugar dehydrogenase [Anaerocolumna chitinilytica]|uniref:UDP-glucose 6-dehydrogenase n=1 Tax=Anaerocolumna chitinilytica TaxID=1727145 RepID=A0A7M3SA59_9FIRM|nr:nucleotide sugar dehydrogenase [Anaerocolumna chitinilytica]BCK01477.1 UDP-glucose dehydrogenase [Anaerocolumna chitinilytica]